MAYVKRKINVAITLGTGDFGEGRGNTVTAEGLRVSANIVKGGLPSFDQAEIRVWGLTQSVMNHVTDLGKPLDRIRNNTIRVSAGDEGGGVADIFSGTIMTAYNDFNDPPNAAVSFTCISAQVEAAKPVPALSIKGSADIVTIMQQIAAAMGKNLVNWGVQGIVIPSPYYPGTATDQMRKAAQAANIWADANGDNLEIWPKDGHRGGLVPVISKATGLIGYPQYADAGVAIRALYQPGLVLGGQFKLETVISPASGTWNILRLIYDLESETPGGKWEMDINAYRPIDGNPVPTS